MILPIDDDIRDPEDKDLIKVPAKKSIKSFLEQEPLCFIFADLENYSKDTLEEECKISVDDILKSYLVAVIEKEEPGVDEKLIYKDKDVYKVVQVAYCPNHKAIMFRIMKLIQ